MTDEDTDADGDRSTDSGVSTEREATETTDIDWVDDDDLSSPAAGEEDASPTAPEQEPSDEDAPLSDLARRVSQRRDTRGSETARTTQSESVNGRDASESSAEVGATGDDTGAGQEGDIDADALFEEMSVGDIEAETLWSSLESDDSAEPVGLGEPASSVSDEGTTRASSQATEHVVSKAEYCQKCPYLTEPPELACAHDGTEIVAVVDADHFRVRECPMVDE